MQYFSTRVSVLPARSFRTDKYVSCRGRDRVCRGVGRRADRPSPGTADDLFRLLALKDKRGFFGSFRHLDECIDRYGIGPVDMQKPLPNGLGISGIEEPL